MAETTLGKRIARARHARLLTQEGLAEAIGVTQVTVARWETDRNVPIMSIRRSLAEALAVEPSDLFAEEAA